MVLKTIGRWRTRALTILGIGALTGGMLPVVAHAAPQLSIDVTVKSDGTPSFDADDTALRHSMPTTLREMTPVQPTELSGSTTASPTGSSTG